jgi:hypothetical protein
MFFVLGLSGGGFCIRALMLCESTQVCWAACQKQGLTVHRSAVSNCRLNLNIKSGAPGSADSRHTGTRSIRRALSSGGARGRYRPSQLLLAYLGQNNMWYYDYKMSLQGRQGLEHTHTPDRRYADPDTRPRPPLRKKKTPYTHTHTHTHTHTQVVIEMCQWRPTDSAIDDDGHDTVAP